MNSDITFICNNETITKVHNPAATLLDFIRQSLKLTGTKEGCREGDCGACSILLGELSDGKIIYKSINSCLVPLNSVIGKHVVTIEGLNNNNLSAIQNAFIEEGATQCGFCTPGFIISFTGHLLSSEGINKNSAADSIAGNLCRCTGHATILHAMEKVLSNIKAGTGKNSFTVSELIEKNIIPSYFEDIPLRLNDMKKNLIKSSSINGDLHIGGGTDLYVQRGRQIIKQNFDFVTNGTDNNIFVKGNRCYIAASTTVSEFSQSGIVKAVIPEVKEYTMLFGSQPIRNRATIGGNIINASPIGDMTNILLALNSSLVFKSDENTRELKLENFYKGYKLLDKKPGEILKTIYFEMPSGTYKINFEKVSKRTHLDIASVNSTIFITTDGEKIENIRITAGGISPIPMLLKNCCSFLTGKIIEPDVILKAADIADDELSPISDARGSADYKRLLLHQLILAHFIKLFPSKIAEETTL